MTIREFYTLVGGSYDDMSERFPSDALRHVVIAAADERVKFADGHWRSSL